MRKCNRQGFTLIEVMLFLAITSLLFFAVTIGVQNSIFEQRYNDTVQSYIEFLRTIYSEVLNVQDIGGGRSERAIYGKLVTFGEKTTPSGALNSDNTIYVYDVVGDAEVEGITSESAKELLKKIGANVVIQGEDGKIKPAGMVESYTLKWGAVINKPCESTCIYDPYKGSLLVVRHPGSGTVYTYLSNTVIEVGEELKGSMSDSTTFFSSKLDDDSFKTDVQIDFCINPDGGETNRIRRDVRIEKGARNASAVELAPDYESVCKKG